MLIYKATNKINNKSYIGLTTRTLEDRKEEHKKEAFFGDEKVFHKAIRKYGFDSFDFSILEDNILDREELKQKEIFYIKHFNTHYLTGFGYNMTYGGDLMESGENHPSSKSTQEEVDQIIFLLKNTFLTYEDIAIKLNLKVGAGQIRYINSGEQWFSLDENYPIRENSRSISKTGINNPQSKLSEEQVLAIIDLLINTRLSQQAISEKFDVHSNTINNINSCKCWTYLHSYKNNIRKECGITAENPTKQMEKEKILEIIYLLSNTNLTQKEISEKTKIGTVTISKINNCKVYNTLHNFKNNIRKEAKEGGTGYEANK